MPSVGIHGGAFAWRSGGGAVCRIVADQILHRALCTWLSAGDSRRVGMYLDQLSVIMMLVVTASASSSTFTRRYMEHEGGYYRYFAYLKFHVLHAHAGAGEQLSADVVGWEEVGLASYLLIGFWFSRRAQPMRQESLHHQPGRRLRFPDALFC